MAYSYDSTDVSAFLSSVGVSLNGSYDLQAELDEVKAEFVEETARDFFVSSPDVAVEKRYDPPVAGVGRIYIRDTYEVTSVKIGYSVPDTGYALTENRDFVLIRWGDGPVVAIDFYLDAGSLQQSVLVTGKIGFSATPPANVWRQIVKETAGRAIRAVPNSEYAAKSLKQGERSIEFGGESRNEAKDTYEKLVVKFRREHV